MVDGISKIVQKKFSVLCKYLFGDDVHLRQNNKIVSCLNRGGVALLNVSYDDKASIFHYLLALKADEEYLYLFDPYYRKRKFSDTALIWLGNTNDDRQAPNLKVERKRLDMYQHKKYSMGLSDERECCIIERI